MTKVNKKNVAEFSKAQLKRAKKLNYNIDLLEILLEDDKLYTLDEVEKLVKAFNDREVRY